MRGSNDISVVKSHFLNHKSHFLIATAPLLLANSALSIFEWNPCSWRWNHKFVGGKSLPKSTELLHLRASAVLGSCWTLEEAIARVAQLAGGDEVIHHWFGLPWSMGHMIMLFGRVWTWTQGFLGIGPLYTFILRIKTIQNVLLGHVLGKMNWTKPRFVADRKKSGCQSWSKPWAMGIA